MRDSLGIHGGTVIERVVLFVLAIFAVFLVNAGLHNLSHDRGGWLYFLGGVFVVVLLVRSWRRLAVSLRKDRAERSVGGPDA